jgi:hypothetical protein
MEHVPTMSTVVSRLDNATTIDSGVSNGGKIGSFNEGAGLLGKAATCRCPVGAVEINVDASILSLRGIAG